MADEAKDLGRLISVHPIAPIYVQRAVFIAVLSFLFFMGTMLAFYLRQSFLYFLLATGFLIVYLITMFGWFMQRRSVANVYDRGFSFKDRWLAWDEVDSINDEGNIVIIPKTGKPISLPATISEPAALARHIRFRISTAGK
jgi:hypothetical protein